MALPRHTIPFFSVVARSHTSETRPGFDGGAYAAAESVRSLSFETPSPSVSNSSIIAWHSASLSAAPPVMTAVARMAPLRMAERSMLAA